MITIIAFLVLLGVIITIHEFGHFAVAKLSGVKVLVFSIGFGRPLFSWYWGETKYQISMLPLGGYVKMMGMADELGADREDEPPATDADAGRSLLDKSPLTRILIAAAGPGMNLLLPFLILIPFYTFTDRADMVPGTTIGALDRGLPAWASGLREGDQILSIDGDEVHTFWQVALHIDQHEPSQGPLEFKVARADVAQPLDLEVMPDRIEQTNAMLGFSKSYNRIGYQPDFQRADVAVVDAGGPVAAAGIQTFDRLLEVDGEVTDRFVDAVRALAKVAPGVTVAVKVQRARTIDETYDFLRATETLTLPYTGAQTERPQLIHAESCVTSVDPNSSAGAELQIGDCIVGVDGIERSLAAFVLTELSNRQGRPKTLSVLRRGQRVEVNFTPTELVIDDPMAGDLTLRPLGFLLFAQGNSVSTPIRVNVPNVDRLHFAWVQSSDRISGQIEIMVRTLGGMFIGDVSPTQLSGPLTIFRLAGEHAQQGIESFLRLMMLLSLSIALINLLPVPVLDGGQIMVAAIELIMRRPMPERFQLALQKIGLVMVIALMLFALTNDAIRMWRLHSAGM